MWTCILQAREVVGVEIGGANAVDIEVGRDMVVDET